ncbi:hypothetical protein AB6A40_011282 [Gnathostoma spinigerum]|uniref:Uncharacterized protein n=1 Tax=Gnathostoma spinigerum TaxID=75299 RepID=A0ABD6EXT1_9BILA
MADSKLEELLKLYPVFEHCERGKLQCTLTGHEIPCQLEQLTPYVQTKKFINAWKIHNIMQKYGSYFDDLGERKYGCKLTMKIIAADPDDLERHIAGKKFRKALAHGQSYLIF